MINFIKNNRKKVIVVGVAAVILLVATVNHVKASAVDNNNNYSSRQIWEYNQKQGDVDEKIFDKKNELEFFHMDNVIELETIRGNIKKELKSSDGVVTDKVKQLRKDRKEFIKENVSDNHKDLQQDIRDLREEKKERRNFWKNNPLFRK